MPAWDAFCSGSARERSESLDAAQTINLFRATVSDEGNAKKRALLGTPGLLALTSVVKLGCRGAFSQDGRTWTVIGDGLYSVDLATMAATYIGVILNDGAPVSFSSNGRGGEQLAIVGGGQLKILTLTSNVLSAAVTLPLTNAPVMVDFLDGYFLLHEANSIRTWYSALENGSSWDALDFFSRSGSSDNLVGILVVGALIWRFGSHTTDACYDSGDADTPFLPVPNSEIGEGACSPWAIGLLGDAPIWMAQNDQGRGWVVTGTVGSASRVSTPAIDYALAKATTLADAEMLLYEQEGHAFACVTCPTLDQTWCYDATEQDWHQRATWESAPGIFHRWRVRGSCAVDGEILVGDYATGDIYTLDLDTFTENGAMIRRLRRAPYLSDESQWGFLDQFELGTEPGVGLGAGQGSAPLAMLRVSRNGAKTWGPTTTATMGAQGVYDARTIWRRLGRSRLDRLVAEVTITDPVRVVLGPGAWLRLTNGSGNL